MKKIKFFMILAKAFFVVILVSGCTQNNKSFVTYEQFLSAFQSAQLANIYVDIPQAAPNVVGRNDSFFYENHQTFYLDDTKTRKEGLSTPWATLHASDELVAEGRDMFNHYYDELYQSINKALTTITVTEVKPPQEISTYTFNIELREGDRIYRLVIDRNMFVAICDTSVNPKERTTMLYQISSDDFRIFTDAIREPTLAFNDDYKIFFDKLLENRNQQSN